MGYNCSQLIVARIQLLYIQVHVPCLDQGARGRIWLHVPLGVLPAIEEANKGGIVPPTAGIGLKVSLPDTSSVEDYSAPGTIPSLPAVTSIAFQTQETTVPMTQGTVVPKSVPVPETQGTAVPEHVPRHK